MRKLRLAATAAVFAVGAFALGSPAAQAAIFMPATLQATCLAACFDKGHAYQQTFAASSFSGRVSIGAFSFDRALLGQDHQTSVFHVTFWTADGREVGDFGHYMVGSLAGEVLTLHGQSFVFDPSLGNLTMKIELDGSGSDAGGGGFAGGSAGPGVTSDPGAAPAGDFIPLGVVNNSGLGFTPPGLIDNPGPQAPASAAPEPAAWALMILGFAGAGAILRRRRLRPA
jgi:hypothetical protein